MSFPIEDRPRENIWLDDAQCRGSDVTFHWSEKPGFGAISAAMSLCRVCPVVQECRQDAANTGERYPWQIRGGLRLWSGKDVALMPEARVGYVYEPPKRPEGRPRGPLSILHIKPDHTANYGRGHVRGPHNTPMPDARDR